MKLFKSFILLSFLMGATQSFADKKAATKPAMKKVKGVQPFNNFCYGGGNEVGVAKWPKGSKVPEDKKYTDNHVGTPRTPQFAFSKYSKPNWIIVDARSKKDRGVGVIPKTISITADYNDPSKNEFKKAKILKKVNRFLNRKKTTYKTFEDMAKNVNFIVFCNGVKCHRSSFGACKLREFGVKMEKVNLMLGGFPAWKEQKGYPVR